MTCWFPVFLLKENPKMRVRAGIGLSCAGVLLVGAALAAEMKSGLQPGDKLSPFHPMNVTGASAGKKNCLV